MYFCRLLQFTPSPRYMLRSRSTTKLRARQTRARSCGTPRSLPCACAHHVVCPKLISNNGKSCNCLNSAEQQRSAANRRLHETKNRDQEAARLAEERQTPYSYCGFFASATMAVMLTWKVACSPKMPLRYSFAHRKFSSDGSRVGIAAEIESQKSATPWYCLDSPV
jgi:hypothetical protein